MRQPSRAWLRQNGMRPRQSKITAVAAVVTLSTGTAVAACASQPQVSIDAGPTVVCGTVLAASAAARVVFDATHHLPTIKHLTVGDVLMFRVARGCDQGARVSWAPSSAARLVKSADAADGKTAAVDLKPRRPRAAFRLIGMRNGRVVASATVNLAP
jgi:hypothetical protein